MNFSRFFHQGKQWNFLSRSLCLLFLCITFAAAPLLAQAPALPAGQADTRRNQPEGSRAGGTRQINQDELIGLPLNGRSYSQLATLQAGVTETAGGSSTRGGGGASINVVGGRATSNTFLLDGTNIMNNDNQVPRSAAGVQLGSDAVLRVVLLSSFYGADYGRGSGGNLNSITCSGSPQIHATVFEYFRNSKLDARNFFTPEAVPTPFKRNQFGSTLTGPLKADRTFFMVSFESLRDRLTETKIDFLPDLSARQGVITDAAGSILQSVVINPRVIPYLALYPVPNSRSLGSGVGENIAQQFQPTNEDFFTVRLDHALTGRDSLFGRYTFDDASSISSQGSAFYLWRQISETRQQYLTLVGSHIFSTQLVSSFRLGYTRPAAASTTLGPDIPRSLFFVPSAPLFGQINVPSLSVMGASPGAPDLKIMNTFQGGSDFILRRGAHTLRFGADVHRYRMDTASGSQDGGIWNFNSLESFLQAGPAGTSLQVAIPGSSNRREFRQTYLGTYLQADLRVRSNWSLNLGLRSEVVSQLRDQTAKHVFVPDPLHDVEPQTGEYLLASNPSLRTLAPRIGFRWSPGPTGNTIVQAGWGVYYDHILAYTHGGRRATAPSFNVVVIPNFDSSSTFPDALAAAANQGSGRARVVLMDYNHSRTPTVYRYTASLQQQLAGSWDLQLTYVGARGNHLLRRYESNQFPAPVRTINGELFFPDDCLGRTQLGLSASPLCRDNARPVNPAFGSMDFLGTDAQSFFNTVQVSASKRVGQALSLQSSYTFSKSVDDDSGANSSAQYGPMRTLERGLSDFDIRHRVSLNYFVRLPFAGARKWVGPGILTKLLDGWRLGGITSYRSGSPVTLAVNVRTPGYLFSAKRPNLGAGQSTNPIHGVSAGCSGVSAGTKLATVERYFDPCAFENPLPGYLGNLGRNTVIGPSTFNTDISLQKDLSIDARMKLQVRMELFNIFNHTNFNRNSGSTAVVFSGSTGRRNSNAGRLVETATTARQMQLALRLSF